jgi:hypothetical protein
MNPSRRDLAQLLPTITRYPRRAPLLRLLSDGAFRLQRELRAGRFFVRSVFLLAIERPAQWWREPINKIST